MVTAQDQVGASASQNYNNYDIQTNIYFSSTHSQINEFMTGGQSYLVTELEVFHIANAKELSQKLPFTIK